MEPETMPPRWAAMDLRLIVGIVITGESLLPAHWLHVLVLPHCATLHHGSYYLALM